MRITDTGDLWWKTAVVYCLDVEKYFDSDGDGIGDLQGLAQRLDYLHELGVTCLWLMPFYPSPNRDDGYDIVDFYGVDLRLGTFGDLVEVLRTARDRGMRVIVDLVVNHTSDEHPWFVESRASRDSAKRDWYVWVDQPPEHFDIAPAFPDQESSVWELDEKTGQYYLHVFYRFQPDLNVANPQVRDEIAKVLGFWLELGISGFRVDAVPFLLDTEGASDAGKLPDPHVFLRELRAFLGRRSGDGMMLGEVNLPHEDQRTFFGDDQGNELTMQFDFISMQRTYLALARGDARPLAEALLARPAVDPDCQWATFMRNHDELTLDKLSDSERQEVFDAFGPEQRMQIYGRGLIRRLPPMLGGDQRRIRMVYSLLFSLPGTPVLFYGEEIGMGEDLSVGSRMAVRSPMQWTSGPNGGFSTAPPDRLAAKMVEGDFGPDRVNVRDQRDDPDSLFSFLQLLIKRYRECPELGWAELEILDQPHHGVLAHQVSWDQARLVALHNFRDESAVVPLRVQLDKGEQLIDLLGHGGTEPDDEGVSRLELEPYGYRWLRVGRPDDLGLY